MPRVFISYSHDSDSHKDRVRALADRLRGDGLEVVIDQDFGGGPGPGFQLWSEQELKRADRVLMVCTASYRRRYDGDEAPGVGLGVLFEARVIRRLLYDAGGINEKFRTILFDGGDADIPLTLKDYRSFRIDAEYDRLLLWLVGTATVPGGAAVAHATPWPSASHGHRPILADRKEEFEVFERMITGRSRERILLLQGASGSGKTTLATELCKYARELRVLCANADLKGCPTQAATLSLLKMRLGTGHFATAPSLDDLLHELRRAERPVLLALDTFESASDETAQWTERCLQMVEDLPFVVAMISGQRVPDASRAGWRLLASPHQLEPISDVADWVNYARAAWPGVAFDVKHIESLVFGTRGNPALLGSLLSNLMNRLPRATAGGGP